VTCDTHEVGVITPDTTVYFADPVDGIILHYRRGRPELFEFDIPTRRNVTNMFDFRYEQVKQNPFLPGLLKVLGHDPNQRLQSGRLKRP
jgi:hypothetical protein